MKDAENRTGLNTATIPSFNVTASAIRLVLAGYLGKLKYNQSEDGHVYFNIPSETRRGALYQLDYDPTKKTARCSCPAGHHGKPCKHFRLFQLQIGAGIVEIAS
jgi:hypothetical protein